MDDSNNNNNANAQHHLDEDIQQLQQQHNAATWGKQQQAAHVVEDSRSGNNNNENKLGSADERGNRIARKTIIHYEPRTISYGYKPQTERCSIIFRNDFIGGAIAGSLVGALVGLRTRYIFQYTGMKAFKTVALEMGRAGLQMGTMLGTFSGLTCALYSRRERPFVQWSRTREVNPPPKGDYLMQLTIGSITGLTSAVALRGVKSVIYCTLFCSAVALAITPFLHKKAPRLSAAERKRERRARERLGY